MASGPTTRVGSDLFIIDNTDSEWDVLRYLNGWCRLSNQLDVASAYFEIGSLLALDGEWQKVDTIRILMGDEVTKRTKNMLARALAERLDASIEEQKIRDDFLDGVPAIVEAIKTGRIQFRVYRKSKFHAKAYITHSREAVVGSFALVGSSNFTRPGLSSNVELNVQISGPNVGLLQDWYEHYWEEAEDISPEMLRTIERHVEAFLPFDIWSRSLSELFRHSSPPADIWAEKHSHIFPLLDGYQRTGYAMMMERATKYGGAFLCDGVGLGKTFVGLMLLEKLVIHENKTVVLLVPKSAKDAVWGANLEKFLPDLMADEGVGGLHILTHTDLSSDRHAKKIAALTRRADAIVVDEAHNFRNPGIAGEGRRRKSRYRVLQELAANKRTFLLTATPVNNSLLDLMHLIELFSGDGARLKQAPLGVHSLRGHFRTLEKKVKAALGEAADAPGIDEDITSGPAHEEYSTDPIVEALVVQRSRAYVKASQEADSKGAAIFPMREPPKVADYTLSPLQTELLEEVVRSFDSSRSLFRLAIYNPDDGFRRTPAEPFDQAQQFEAGRRGQVVALVKVGFLKRLESSTVAFDHSCQNLFLKLYAFVEKHVSEDHRGVWERWKDQQAQVISHVREGQAAWREDESDEGDDLISPEMLDDVPTLSDTEYFVDRIVEETRADLDQLCRLLDILRGFTPAQDGKIAKLLDLIKSDPVLSTQKLLIFSEFMTTARYIRDQLRAAGFENVEQVDSATKLDRGEVIKRFAPYYNGSSSAELNKAGHAETRILVSTDVLSEGLNLQDASRLINYDLHWNPVRLMQRIGRVDRRLNPVTEAEIVKAHPDTAAVRRNVVFWNFLPADALTPYLKLYERVAGKVLRISKTFGIEGRQLLTGEDDYDDLRNLVSLDGDKSVEESLQLEWEALKANDPALAERVEGLPNRIFSGRAAADQVGKGVFFCLALPGLDPDAPEDAGPEGWNPVSGKPAWYYVDHEGAIAEGLGQIAAAIRSTPDVPRHLNTPRERLRAARDAVLKHVRNGYMKQMQAPPGVEPVIKAWMEIN